MYRRLSLSLFLTAALPFQAANSNPNASPAPASGAAASSAVSTLIPTAFETVPAGEAEQISEVVNLTTQLLQQRYGDAPSLRGVHPKAHGCVHARFTVEPDLSSRFRVGLFATPGKSYDAWIRFSNATSLVTSDLNPESGNPSRGMAIKVMGVAGETLLNEPGAKTQDFLLINQPMFAFAKVAQYLEVTRLQFRFKDDNSKIFPALFQSATPENLATRKIVGQIAATPMGDPLESRYFSASPFLFGAKTVAKFAVSPRDPDKTPVPAKPSPNYLREAMKKRLLPGDGRPAVFDFQVQIRSTNALAVENASAEWPEDTAPYQTIAYLTIQSQDFDRPERDAECERLVFTPWHGLAEHRPLGGINRMRYGVYKASAHYRGGAPEPSGFIPSHAW